MLLLLNLLKKEDTIHRDGHVVEARPVSGKASSQSSSASEASKRGSCANQAIRKELESGGPRSAKLEYSSKPRTPAPSVDNFHGTLVFLFSNLEPTVSLYKGRGAANPNYHVRRENVSKICVFWSLDSVRAPYSKNCPYIG